MDFRSSWKGQFVGQWTNTIDDMIGAIQILCQLVMSLGFEICLFVRLESEKHMITFLKNLFWMMLVHMFLHAILIYVEVILHVREGGCYTLQHFFNRLDLWCAYKICSDCRCFFSIHRFIWGHFNGHMIWSIVPPLCQGKPSQVVFQTFFDHFLFFVSLGW